VTNILNDTSITTQFTFPSSVVNLSASAFTLNGTFLGFKSLHGGLLQLCKNSDSFLDAAYVFGTVFKQTASSLYNCVLYSVQIDSKLFAPLVCFVSIVFGLFVASYRAFSNACGCSVRG